MTREELKEKKIAVLMGGMSAEREVSLRSGGAVLSALREAGFHAIGIDAGRDLPQRLAQEKVEVAFIALHGRFGEDGTVQGVLELMGIPYTGSGVLASAVAMHKLHAKRMFEAAGLLTAPFRHFRRGESVDPRALPFGYPLVVKPAREGSSVGVSIVRGTAEFAEAVEAAFRYDDEILVERYVKGQEVQVGILDEKAIGAIEIVPKREFYDYEAKYTDGLAEHIYPARLSPDVYARALQTGLAAHQGLGCHGYSRVDLLVTSEGECFVLEVNTLPGMTALSLLPEIAWKGAGLSFGELTQRILEGAGLNK